MHHAPPRWYIPGVTPRPSKPFVPSRQRSSMRLVVFIKKGHRPIVVSTQDMAAGRETAASGSIAGDSDSTWNSQLFCRIVKNKLLGDPSNRAGRLSMPVKLALDRDPVHLNNLFKNFASVMRMKVLFLPSKGPDLDPLDYGIFGSVKQAWDKRCFRERYTGQMSWQQACQQLIQMLQAVNPDPHIAALPSRIAKCIEAEGGHFEQ